MAIQRYLCDQAASGVMELAELLPGDRPIARFRETWFHPQGGGQRADRGKIGAATVIDVRHGEGGTVDHYLDTSAGFDTGRTYPFRVDAEWRLLNSRYHTGAHLLVGVVEQMFPGLTVAGGHQWPGEARVEFVGSHLHRVVDQCDALEAAIRSQIAADLSVVLFEDRFAGRMCRVGAYEPIPCSGTHVQSTSDLGDFKLRSAKVEKHRVRVGYEVLGPQVASKKAKQLHEDLLRAVTLY